MVCRANEPSRLLAQSWGLRISPGAPPSSAKPMMEEEKKPPVENREKGEEE